MCAAHKPGVTWARANVITELKATKKIHLMSFHHKIYSSFFSSSEKPIDGSPCPEMSQLHKDPLITCFS